jgi:cysteine desulfurase
MKKKLFLDANAHVPMSDRVLKVFNDYQKSNNAWGNVNTLIEPGIKSTALIEEAREKIARYLGCNSNQLFFTYGATQACQWGIKILEDNTDKIYYSSVEHSAVRDAVELYGANTIEKIPVDNNGVIKETKFKNYGIAVMSIQNEIGTIEPIEELEGRLIFSDMCQSVGKVPIDLKNIDIAVFGAHKFGGPTSIGLLYLRNIDLWQPFGTGSRYYMDRPGTIDCGSILAAAESIEETRLTFDEKNARNGEFQKELEERLQNEVIKIIGYGAKRVNNTTFIKIPKIALLVQSDLNSNGIYLGTGSACNKVHTGPSLTLTAIGEDADTDSYLRISQHGQYGKEDAKYFFDKLMGSIRKYK